MGPAQSLLKRLASGIAVMKRNFFVNQWPQQYAVFQVMPKKIKVKHPHLKWIPYKQVRLSLITTNGLAFAKRNC